MYINPQPKQPKRKKRNKLLYAFNIMWNQITKPYT